MISEAKKEAIFKAAQAWHGTPFREHTELRGVGADCVHLARGVLISADFSVPPIENRDYPLDWAKHRAHSLVTEWVEQTGKFRLLPDGTPPQAGDLLCIRQGRCSHHVALMVDERWFLHTEPGRYAAFGMIDDPAYSGLMECVYRLMEAEEGN